jgi:hypothetical protein
MNTDEIIFSMLFQRIPIICAASEWPILRRAVEHEAIKWQWANDKDWVNYAVTEMNRLDALHGRPSGALSYADWFNPA